MKPSQFKTQTSNWKAGQGDEVLESLSDYLSSEASVMRSEFPAADGEASSNQMMMINTMAVRQDQYMSQLAIQQNSQVEYMSETN